MLEAKGEKKSIACFMSRSIACGSHLHPRMNTKPKPFTQEVTDLLEGRWGRDSGVTGKTKAARSAQFQYLYHSPSARLWADVW